MQAENVDLRVIKLSHFSSKAVSDIYSSCFDVGTHRDITVTELMPNLSYLIVIGKEEVLKFT